MKNEKITSIVFVIILLVAMAMGVVLVQQTQELRKGAYFADTEILLQPTEINTKVGEEFRVQIWVDTADNAKVDGLQTDLCFDGDLVSPKTSSTGDLYDAVVFNSEAGFNQVPLALAIEDGGQCVRLAITSNRPASALKSGMVNVGAVVFKAVGQGSGSLTMKLDKSTVTGDNPGGGMDTYMKVVNVKGANVIVGEGSGGSAEDMWLNYKVAFSGVKKDRMCADNWQTKLTVISGSSRKEYTSAVLTKTNQVNDKGEVIYEGSMQLAGFRQSGNVAVFFKGPKHLQVKYGKNGQTEFYNKAGGEIGLTNSKTTSPVFDFSKYPMMAGDINGDGVVDGVDFTSIKPKAAAFTEIASGGYLAEDLDGSCQVNNNDIILLVRSLNEKQDQVY